MKTTIIPTLLISIVISLVSAGIFGFIGYQSGREIGSSIVYAASFEIGYLDAIGQNTERGYQEGLDQGLTQGASQAEENLIQSVRETAFREGKNQGYSEGFATGMTQGKEAGIKEALASGREATIRNFFQSQQSVIISELNRQNYTCNTQNICERVFSDDRSIDRREWYVFNLNNLTHEFNVTYVTDAGNQMKQKVVVDYLNGQMNASWVMRSQNFPNPPTLVYEFSTQRLTRNNTSSDNQSQIDWLFGWYNPRGLPIDENTGLRWVLTANRS
jgi:hypothetical protein